MAWLLFLIFLTKNAECIMNPGFKPSQPDIFTQSLSSNQFSSVQDHQTYPENKIILQRETEHAQNFIGSHGDIYTNTTLETAWNPIKIEITPDGTHTHNATGHEKVLHFLVKNDGTEDEYVHLTVSDEKGYAMGNSASEFPLPSQSSKEVSVRMDYPLDHTPNSADLITIQARGKRNTLTVKRSIYPPGNDLEYGGRNGPFCYDRYVTGNCRYRTDPEYCFQYEWTAYAIVQNIGGSVQTIRSEPEGLVVPTLDPGQDRVRVWVKVSCCTPFIKIISIDTYSRSINACVVDVRELQGLHPAEIAGIVLGVLFVLIVIIVVIALIIRRRRARSISVGQTTLHRHTHSSRTCVAQE